MRKILFGAALAVGLAFPILHDVQATAEQGVDALHVVDGDTIHLGTERIRLMGYDTPELRGECVAERERAREARRILKVTLENFDYSLERHGVDRYGRTLAVLTVHDDEGSADMADVMVLLGLARYYDGGRRVGWCD